MGYMKEQMTKLSEDMGLDGEITGAVIVEFENRQGQYDESACEIYLQKIKD